MVYMYMYISNYLPEFPYHSPGVHVVLVVVTVSFEPNNRPGRLYGKVPNYLKIYYLIIVIIQSIQQNFSTKPMQKNE